MTCITLLILQREFLFRSTPRRCGSTSVAQRPRATGPEAKLRDSCAHPRLVVQGGGEWMVLGRGEDGFAGDGLGVDGFGVVF